MKYWLHIYEILSSINTSQTPLSSRDRNNVETVESGGGKSGVSASYNWFPHISAPIEGSQMKSEREVQMHLVAINKEGTAAKLLATSDGTLAGFPLGREETGSRAAMWSLPASSRSPNNY